MLREELRSKAAEGESISLSGPKVSLPSKAAEILGLAIHELATNALKYGALREPGRIVVRWSRAPRDNVPWLSLRWRESGVAINDLAPEPGFGTELITRRIPYELDGEGALNFTADGVTASIAFPLTNAASVLDTDSGIVARAAP